MASRAVRQYAHAGTAADFSTLYRSSLRLVRATLHFGIVCCAIQASRRERSEAAHIEAELRIVAPALHCCAVAFPSVALLRRRNNVLLFDSAVLHGRRQGAVHARVKPSHFVADPEVRSESNPPHASKGARTHARTHATFVFFGALRSLMWGVYGVV